MTTIYLKITDKKKSSRIESREAWDVDVFLKSVTESYKKDKDNPCKVTVATREDYLKQIKRGVR